MGIIELSNRHLLAKVDTETGFLTFLADDETGRNLIATPRLVYCKKDVGTWHGHDALRKDLTAIPCLGVTPGDGLVTARFQDAHLAVQIRYSLPSGSPLLAIETKVRGCSAKAAALTFVALPGFTWSDDFLDAFEDEDDCYSDGAELGGGFELPCWRVFHRAKRKDGLLLATRSKQEMAHMVIHARGFSVEPQARLNYTSQPVAIHPPLEAGSKRIFRNRFELGPWQLANHRKIIKSAGLAEPFPGKAPKPLGRPRKGLIGKIVDLVKVAGDAASETYSPRRWQIVHVPWARKGRALFATTGVMPPAIRFDPRLRGVYRVHVGIGPSSGAAMRVTGDPETRLRKKCSSMAGAACDDAFRLFLSGRQQIRELDFGLIRLDGRKLTLMRFPNRQSPAVLDYIRFERLSPKEEAAFLEDASRQPVLPLSGLVDTPDLSVLLDGDDPDPRTIASTLWEHANSKVLKCHWRIDGQCSDFPSRHNTMRYISAKVHSVYCPHAKAYGRLLKKCDALRVAVDAARKYGVSLWGWMRFNNYTGNVQSDFFKQHPEFWEENEAGGRGGKLCLAHPEVRSHKINILVEAAQYGLEGLCIGILRHPPVVGYAPVVREAYEREFGRQPPLRSGLSSAEINFSCKHPDRDPEFERWWKFRAGYMTVFGRELRAALARKKLSHVKVALWLRPNHCLFDGIDLDAWLDEGLCDEVITQSYVGINPAAEIDWDRPEWKEGVRSSVPLVRAVWNDYEQEATSMVPRILREGYDGICFYESNETVITPEFIELCRSLRQARLATPK